MCKVFSQLYWTQRLQPMPQKWFIAYELKCHDCSDCYIWQAGRTVKAKFSGHIQIIFNDSKIPFYCQGILNTEHSYGSLEDNLETKILIKKGHIFTDGEVTNLLTLQIKLTAER
jgi:predicted heme/steroid binding protein